MAKPLAESVEEYDYEGLPPTCSTAQTLTAGALAGIAEHTVMYPVDAIKTRMQVLTPSSVLMRNGVLQGGIRIAKAGGVLSLWRGMPSVIAGAGPAHAIHFTVFEKVKRELAATRPGQHYMTTSLIAGACATVVNEMIMTPFDTVKQRMQVSGSQNLYSSVGDCVKKVSKAEGLRAFYISYPATVATSVPMTSIQFCLYDELEWYLNPTKEYKPMIHCSVGAFAGGFAGLVTTPMDVIKTMLQTRGTAQDPELRTVNGLVQGIKLLYAREGAWGFFKGYKPRVLTNIPSAAVSWSVYEAWKSFFIRKNDDQIA